MSPNGAVIDQAVNKQQISALDQVIITNSFNNLLDFLHRIRLFVHSLKRPLVTVHYPIIVMNIWWLGLKVKFNYLHFTQFI